MNQTPLPYVLRVLVSLVLIGAALVAVGIIGLSLFALFLGGWVAGVPLIVVMAAASIALMIISTAVLAAGNKRVALVGLAVSLLPFGCVAYVKIHNWQVHREWQATEKVIIHQESFKDSV